MDSPLKRATVYLDPDVHRALRLKAAASDRSISDMVNEAVKVALAEDAEDLLAVKARESEPTISFASFVKKLKARGQI